MVAAPAPAEKAAEDEAGEARRRPPSARRHPAPSKARRTGRRRRPAGRDRTLDQSRSSTTSVRRGPGRSSTLTLTPPPDFIAGRSGADEAEATLGSPAPRLGAQPCRSGSSRPRPGWRPSFREDRRGRGLRGLLHGSVLPERDRGRGHPGHLGHGKHRVQVPGSRRSERRVRSRQRRAAPAFPRAPRSPTSSSGSGRPPAGRRRAQPGDPARGAVRLDAPPEGDEFEVVELVGGG